MNHMNKKSKERCAFMDSKGLCTNDDNQGGGFRCDGCENFVAESSGGEEVPATGAQPGRRGGVRYLKTLMIPMAQLEAHPDAAAFGAEAEDRTALKSSIMEVGILDPISVMEADGGERYLVLDGCGRLAALRDAGADEALCMVFDLGEMSPSDFALQRNTMQRKVTTGQRLLCYLTVNRAAVLDAAEHADGLLKTELRSRDRSSKRDYASRAIAERLGVSDKDVRAGVELLRQDAEVADLEDDAPAAALRTVWERVMQGATPIRRWRPAWEGIQKTKGAAKAPTDHAALATRALTSLRTVFTGWHEIPAAAHPVLLDIMLDVLKTAPDSAEQTIYAAADELKARRLAKTKRRRADEEA